MTYACYQHTPGNRCRGTLVPEDPARLTGPDVGEVVQYRDESYPRWDRMLVRVKERSYVWAPEQHRPDGYHGFRHYDWTVIEWPELRYDGLVHWHAMVVDDDKLARRSPNSWGGWDWALPGKPSK